MQLTDILKPRNIQIPLAATDKQAAIRELVGLLAGNGDLGDADKVLEAVMEREEQRTTGIGNGLAIPHGKSTGVDRVVMAIGKPAKPIDFAAVDDRPVGVIWLLVSPPDKKTPHIHALARISRLMTMDKFRAAVAKSDSAEALYQLIVKQEEQM